MFGVEYPSFVGEDYIFVSSDKEEVLKEVDRRVKNRTIKKVHTKELKFDNGLIVDNESYPFRVTAFKSFLKVLGFSTSSACNIAGGDSELFNNSMNRLLLDHDTDIYIIIDADGNCIRGVSVDDEYFGEEYFVRNVLSSTSDNGLVIVHGILSDPYYRFSFSNPENRIIVGDNAFDVSFDTYFQDFEFKASFATYITNVQHLGGMVVPTYPGVRKHFSLKTVKTLEKFNERVIQLSSKDYYNKNFDKIEKILSMASELQAKDLPDYAIYRRDAKRALKPHWEGSKLSKEIGRTQKGDIKYGYNDDVTVGVMLDEIVEKAQMFKENLGKNYNCEKLAGKVLSHAEDFISKIG